MRHDDAVRVAYEAIATPQADGEAERLIAALSTARSTEQRSWTALRLGFVEGPDVVPALRRALAEDPDGSVRFTAAQALLTGHRDLGCIPAVATLVSDMAATGERDALDPATWAVNLVVAALGHALKGFHRKPRAAAIVAMRDATAEALVVARRLRSRHRRELDGAMETFDLLLGIGTPRVSPHAALIAQVPADLTSPPLEVDAGTGTDWMDRRLNRALRDLGVRPRDVVVVSATGGGRMPGLMVMIRSVPGCSAERLADAFLQVIHRPARTRWAKREIGGRDVQWASATEWTTAWWTREAMVIQVSGDAEKVKAAIPRLP